MEIEILDEIHRPFCEESQDKEYCFQNCQTRFAYYCEKCNFKCQYLCLNKDVSMYMCQHRCEHKCLMCGKKDTDLMEICKLLGISSSMLSKIDNRVYKDFKFTQEEIESYKVEDMWKREE